LELARVTEAAYAIFFARYHIVPTSRLAGNAFVTNKFCIDWMTIWVKSISSLACE